MREEVEETRAYYERKVEEETKKMEERKSKTEAAMSIQRAWQKRQVKKVVEVSRINKVENNRRAVREAGENRERAQKREDGNREVPDPGEHEECGELI